MELFDNDLFEDDLEVLEIINHGFPRQVHDRKEYFHSMDDLSFFRRFRLTKETAMNVLNQIEDRLEFPYDMNNSVSPINQLLVALRYYSTGNHLLAIADFGGMHTSTACRIVKRVSEAVAGLYERHIKFPSTREERLQMQRKFYDVAAFPRVIGAIDGSHIKIQSPGGEDAEVFRNRKGYFSINVQAVSDANLKFVNVVARWPGSTHDVTIFNNSVLRMQFENGVYPDTFLLGDSGYNVRHYLLTPLLEPHTPSQQLYNEAHIRTRNIVERLFGVWKRRFPVMAYGCRLKLQNMLTVIVATAVLHNICRDMGEEEPPVLEEIEQHRLDHLIQNGDVQFIQPAGANVRNAGMEARNNLIENYFANLE